MAITINNVRLSYCNLFQAKPPYNNPNGDPKFSCTILVPKTNTEAKTAIDAAIQQAIEQGVSKSWGGVRPPQPNICVHDGDGVRPSDGAPFGAECRGMWVVTASAKAALLSWWMDRCRRSSTPPRCTPACGPTSTLTSLPTIPPARRASDAA